MSPGESPNVDAERHELIKAAVDLRRKGKSYRDIATEQKCSVSTAFQRVWAHFSELDQMATEQLEGVRKLELARLDKMLERLCGIMDVGGDDEMAIKAIGAATKLMERRAKLLGLDAPTKVDVANVSDARKKLAAMTPEERLALHEKAAAEERAKLAERTQH